MKKKILFILPLALMILFAGCEKKSYGLTGKVDYVVLKLIGEKQILLELNEPYVEEGWTATDKGKDVHDAVVVIITNMLGEEVDEVTTDAPGLFTITYIATSEDGVVISDSRQVIAYDPNLTISLANTYDVDFDKSKRLDGSRDWTWTQWSAMYTDPAQWDYAAYSLTSIQVNFEELAPGIYEVDDLLGGFYAGLRGYGPYYAETAGPSYANYYSMEGMVLLNADSTFSLVSSYIRGWQEGMDDLKGSFNPDSNLIELHSYYGGMDFNVVMVNQ